MDKKKQYSQYRIIGLVNAEEAQEVSRKKEVEEIESTSLQQIGLRILYWRTQWGSFWDGQFVIIQSVLDTCIASSCTRSTSCQRIWELTEPDMMRRD